MTERITSLNPATTPLQDNDLLEVSVVSPTPASKRATVAQLRGAPAIELFDENVSLGHFTKIHFTGASVSITDLGNGEANVVFAGEGSTAAFSLAVGWNGLVGYENDYTSLLRMPIPYTVTFAANFAGSYAVAEIPATYDTTIYVYKNGTYVGEVTFLAGQQVGVFASSGSVVFNPGDVLVFQKDWERDPSLANIGVTFVGTR